MAYFRNRTVNLLNLHYGIHSLALTGGGAFFAVFLLKSGVPVPGVLASLAGILLGRFIIRPSVLPLAKRFGLKPLLIAGTVATGLQYPLLAEVHGVGWMLFALCAAAAVGDTLYWTTYHAYFASLGDAEHRGQQIGMREAIAALIGIVAPLATGWALVALGPRIAFDVTAVVLVLAALPIFYTPNVAVRAIAPNALKAAIPGVLLFLADGWIASGFVFVWQIALFVSLGESFTAFGGAMAISALAGAVSGLLLGRFIDAGHGARAVWIAVSVLAAVTVLRAFSFGNATFAVFANAFGALVTCTYAPALMTVVYNRARRSPCPLRFHIATEGGWDAGAGAGCLTAAAMYAAGVPMRMVLLLLLLGAVVSFFLLRRYYADERALGLIDPLLGGIDTIRSQEPEPAP